MENLVSTTQRKAEICELLREGKPVTVSALSKRFGVSEMTVRRDLAQLEAEGKLTRTRGGAEPMRTAEYEPFFCIRARENAAAKLAVARAAADLVKDGDVIIVDVGTTLLEFVRLLGQKRITVLTNWVPNIVELTRYPNVRTVALGGTLRNTELSLVGGMVSEALAGFNADRAFLGVGGISVDRGLTDYNLDEVEVKRIMARSAREVVVLADHAKIERVAPVKVGPLNLIHTLVTSSLTSDEQCEAFRRAGVRVIPAPPEEGGDLGHQNPAARWAKMLWQV